MAAAAVAVTLAACSSPGSAETFTHRSDAPISSAPAVTTETLQVAQPKSPSAAELGARACDSVHQYFLSVIVPTFKPWNPRTDEFDIGVARRIEDEALHLASMSRRAPAGSVRLAIVGEELALYQFGLAMEERSDSAVAAASPKAKRALANLRNVCNWG